MLSFLVALAYYLALIPGNYAPEVSVSEYASPSMTFLPLAAEAAQMAEQVVDESPVKIDADRLGVVTQARAAYAMDWKTGTILFSKNAHAPQAIASITKLVTALVVLDMQPDWEQVVVVQGSDMRVGNIPYVIPGEEITVRDLFHVSLVASGNGATIALARSTGLSPELFAERMNAKGVELGMQHASFVEPTGLDSGNKASAADVALLLKEALSREEIRKVVGLREYRFTAETGLDHYVVNTDELLDSFLTKPPYTFFGGKTGYIGEAGYCFGAAAANAEGDRVIAVVLGADSKEARFREVKNILFWVFDAYRWP